MIIRPACRKEFVALPNSLFNDKRLSADTRALIAVLLSKPPGWELRPVALAKLLSRQGGRPVGRTRLSRMFAEAAEAGYLARSQKQTHKDDGTWGRYDYYVGMPDDVVRAVQKAGVAIAPQRSDPHEDEPRAADDNTNHKEQKLQKTKYKNRSPHQLQLHQLGALLPKGWPTEGRGRRARKPQEGQEVVQHRVAVRLGHGDAARGWLIFGGLPDARRDTLTALERSGRLSEDEVLAVLDGLGLASSSPGAGS
jgi:hypothetical protein